MAIVIIHKEKIPIGEPYNSSIPSNAALLSVQVQGEDICVWYEVPLFVSATSKQFMVLVTGTNHVQDDMILDHIGTVQIGRFVGHVYEINRN